MPTQEPDPLNELEYRRATGRRACHEALELYPVGDGLVRVVNASYGTNAEDEHSHVVRVDEGIPISCSCPAWKFHTGACKHMVRVALSPNVIKSVEQSTVPRRALLADGGIIGAGDEGAVLSERARELQPKTEPENQGTDD